MKHARLITRTPELRYIPKSAQTTTDIFSNLITGVSALEIKVQFLVLLTDRAVTYVLQKGSAL